MRRKGPGQAILKSLTVAVPLSGQERRHHRHHQLRLQKGEAHSHQQEEDDECGEIFSSILTLIYFQSICAINWIYEPILHSSLLSTKSVQIHPQLLRPCRNFFLFNRDGIMFNKTDFVAGLLVFVCLSV